MSKILIGELNKGFHKIVYENGTFKYVSPKKLAELKSEEDIKIEDDLNEEELNSELEDIKIEDDLNDLKKPELLEIAIRYGLDEKTDLNKKELIKFIEAKK